MSKIYIGDGDEVNTRCVVCGTADLRGLILADNRSGTLKVTCAECHQKYVDNVLAFGRKYPRDTRAFKL